MFGRSLTINRRLVSPELIYFDDNILMNKILVKQLVMHEFKEVPTAAMP